MFRRAIAAIVTVVMMTTAIEASASPASLLAHKIADMRAACPREKVSTTTRSVIIAPRVSAAIVTVTATGACFGQVGKNTYLIARRGAGAWRIVLSAEPGVIQTHPRSDGWASITSGGIGMCELRYDWIGEHYNPMPSRECGAIHPPTLEDLARLVRGQ